MRRPTSTPDPLVLSAIYDRPGKLRPDWVRRAKAIKFGLRPVGRADARRRKSRRRMAAQSRRTNAAA